MRIGIVDELRRAELLQLAIQLGGAHQVAWIAANEAALHDPDLYSKNPARFAALTKTLDEQRAAKDTAEHRWLEVAELAEQLGL